MSYVCIRQVQYCQIAYQKFLVTENCIEKGSKNIFFLIKKVYAILSVSNRHFLFQILLCTNALLENGP